MGDAELDRQHSYKQEKLIFHLLDLGSRGAGKGVAGQRSESPEGDDGHTHGEGSGQPQCPLLCFRLESQLLTAPPARPFS